MPKQSYDRKSYKMIDVIKKVAFRNRTSRKVKFNYFSEMVSNIDMSFLYIINMSIPTVKINPKHLETHFLSLPVANINHHKIVCAGNDVLHISFLRFSECMKKLCNAQFFIETFEKMHTRVVHKLCCLRRGRD